MMRIFLLGGAATTAIGSIASVVALPPLQSSPRVVTTTRDGQPIMLGAMVVTAKALPDPE